MPPEAEGKEVVVAGKAFFEELSVEELRHLAEDEGKGEEEIAQITQPRLNRAFIAHGVLIKENSGKKNN